MPNEDLAEYQRFTQNMHDDMKPIGALEIQLAQSLAEDAWRLNRAKAIETNLLTMSLNRRSESIDVEHPEVREAFVVADALREQTKALATLSMHQNRIARAFDRTLAQLRQIQAERRERERQDLAEAAAPIKTMSEKPKHPSFRLSMASFFHSPKSSSMPSARALSATAGWPLFPLVQPRT